MAFGSEFAGDDLYQLRPSEPSNPGDPYERGGVQYGSVREPYLDATSYSAPALMGALFQAGMDRNLQFAEREAGGKLGYSPGVVAYDVVSPMLWLLPVVNAPDPWTER